MSDSNVSSGGAVERAIWFFSGCIMGVLGSIAAYMCYQWGVKTPVLDYRWAYISVSATMAFLMLRGSWFTVMPSKDEKRVQYNTGGR